MVYFNSFYTKKVEDSQVNIYTDYFDQYVLQKFKSYVILTLNIFAVYKNYVILTLNIFVVYNLFI